MMVDEGGCSVPDRGGSRRTLLVGLNVNFAKVHGEALGRRIDVDMLTLFSELFADVEFAAYGPADRPDRYDTALPGGGKVCWLSTLSPSGWVRVVSQPVTYAKLYRAVARVSLVYSRLPSPFGMSAIRMARLMGRPVVISMHGDVVDVLLASTGGLPRGKQWPVKMRAWYLERRIARCLRSALHVFFVGSELSRKYGQYAPRSSVFANYLHGEVAGRRDRITDASGGFRLLYVGGIGYRKGTRVLLDAFRQVMMQLPNCTLTLAGSTVGDEWLCAEAEKPDLLGHLITRGWISDAEALATEYRNADLFVLPSISGEGVPKVVIEAMANGTPVVATDTGGVRDLIGDDVRGWLARPNDADDLARAILEALSDKSERSRRAAAATAFASDHDAVATQEQLRQALVEALDGVVSGVLATGADDRASSEHDG